MSWTTLAMVRSCFSFIVAVQLLIAFPALHSQIARQQFLIQQSDESISSASSLIVLCTTQFSKKKYKK